MHNRFFMSACFVALALPLTACNEQAAHVSGEDFGANPKLVEPVKSLTPTVNIATVNIATAKGWPEGARPIAASGTAANAFATGLDHPRTLYVLPNSEVVDDVGNNVWRVTSAGAKAASLDTGK
jgi:glucose/arabinose dehydrogenase